MKFTLAWLKDHLETEAAPAEIGRALTMLGLEVEGIDDRAAALAPFTVAYVVSAEPHPQADRLRVCRVDTGSEVVQVVCGAPNARTGMKGVFARSGTVIPRTGLLLKKSSIRGVESNGMLCSAYEMGISDDHEGIIDLPADAPVGKPFAELMGLQDPVFDVKATPNRPDCLGVRGIARDLAAAGVGRLKPLDTSAVPGTFKSPVRWRRDFPADAMDACPLVVGRYFRNVRNGPSPKWLQDRLTAIGLRPISALVDITNLMTYDLGRPLHAYDADKIRGGELVIRFARAGESFLALNGKTYALEPDMIGLGDADGIDDLAGIMGGERTSCSETTTNMFLEAAIFDPIRVAATGRKLGLTSDARYRFERGLDQTGPFWGTEIATRLVLQLCGGEASELVVEGAETAWRRQIPLRLARVAALGGVAVPALDKRRILGDLGFEVWGEGDTWQVMPPPWRGDVEGEADLVEEVLRVHGYDNIPVVPLTSPTALPVPAVTPAQRRVSQMKRLLATRGLTEAVTFSFLPGKQARLFGGGQAELELVNPISADLDVMRPTPLPNLIAAAGRNADRGIADQALFEVGPAYADATPKGQSLIACGIRVGQSGPRHWRERARAVDAYDVKADALALLAACGLPVENLQQATDAPGWYHPGRSASLRIGPMLLARFGEIHPAVLHAMDVRGPIAAFEVILSAVPLPKARKSATRALARLAAFQPVERDFAFLVDEVVPAEKLVRAARGVDKALITDVQVFDVYRGEGVGAGRKSVALAVRLQPAEATLTEAEIEAVAGRIVAAVAEATGAELRK